jgi:hypothetical protein
MRALLVVAYVVAGDGTNGNGAPQAAVYGFSLDLSTGVLTPLAGSPFIQSASPSTLTI